MKSSNCYRLIELLDIKDPRGNITVGEFCRHVPFEAKRFFVVYQVPLVEMRGEHAHRECHQFLICMRGRISVVGDDGWRREKFLMDRPNLGFYMPPMTWGGQFDYSPDAVLLVFASHYYDATDYLRDYDEFLDVLKGSS